MVVTGGPRGHFPSSPTDCGLLGRLADTHPQARARGRPGRGGQVTPGTGPNQPQDILSPHPPLQGRASYRTPAGYKHFCHIYKVTGPSQPCSRWAAVEGLVWLRDGVPAFLSARTNRATESPELRPMSVLRGGWPGGHSPPIHLFFLKMTDISSLTPGLGSEFLPQGLVLVLGSEFPAGPRLGLIGPAIPRPPRSPVHPWQRDSTLRRAASFCPTQVCDLSGRVPLLGESAYWPAS